ncbi:MAG: hypothetical protein KIC37_05175 [Coriobacteriaceae bacterium]|nr:hypothetical protein [Coriobacteriaceae bacterium]
MIEDTWTPPEFSDYQNARDLFNACREAALDADRIARTLSRMESREDVQAQSYEITGHAGHRCDPHAATDARMAYEIHIAKRQQWDYQLIDLVSALAYGQSFTGFGGIASIMGASYADVIWWRCCAAASWDEVAYWCSKSRSWCVGAYADVCRVIDVYGAKQVLEGLGLSED